MDGNVNESCEEAKVNEGKGMKAVVYVYILGTMLLALIVCSESNDKMLLCPTDLSVLPSFQCPGV